MRIGIFGGTFNPPHIGHTGAAVAARDELSLDKLIFIPSSIPPHKELASGSATEKQRLDMTRIAASEISAEVSDIEISRGGKSYTVETLREFRRLYPSDELWFIMGTDMFLSIEKWREPQEIMRLAKIAVVPRYDESREKLRLQSEHLSEKYGATTHIIDKPALEISSTEIREALECGNASEFISEGVCNYIRKENLYGI